MAKPDLLLTKFFPPAAPTPLVSRPRLVEQLTAAITHSLTLVSAPAGFGKTTALAEWIRQCRQPVTWLSLDEYDNDPARFWTHTIAAIQKLQPSLGHEALALLRAPQPSWAKGILTALINSIHGWPQDFTLVLDGCHLITNSLIFEGLNFLLDHAPAQMHLVMLSRADPPLPVARWLADGHLTVVGAGELRFTNAEATLFISQALGPNVPAETINALVVQTEGWITGLRLAAFAIREGGSVNDLIKRRTGGRRHLHDYLIDQVLSRLPDRTQSFLLETSILDRMSAGLCDAVTGREHSQEVLLHLDRANLFVVPLDDEQRWYRYHHLFAELLRRLAETRYDISAFHQRASVWYEHEGLTREAIEHALKARDMSRAAALIEPEAEAVMHRGELVTIMRWLHALPAEVVRSRAGLCLWAGWSQALTHAHTAAESYLQLLETMQDTDTAREGLDTNAINQREQARQYAGQIAVIRSTMALNEGRLTAASDYSHQALDTLHKHDLRLRSLVALQLGLIGLAHGEVGTAEQVLSEACWASQVDRHFYIQLVSLGQLARLRLVQGRLLEAEQISLQALALTSEHKMHVSSYGVHISLGNLYYEKNDFDAAFSHLQEGLRLAELAGAPAHLCQGYIACARLLQARGDTAAADDFVAQAQQAGLRCQGVGDKSWVAAWQARLWLQQGRTESAVQWARAAVLIPTGKLDHRRELEYLTWARLLVAQKQWQAACELLEPLRRAAESAGRLSTMLETLVIQAGAEAARGQAPIALAKLRLALALAEPHGHLRLFIDEGEVMRQMIVRVRSQIASRDCHLRPYLDRILHNFPFSTACAVRPAPPDRLTEGELLILGCIAEGMANRAIAQELVLAQSTVEWHIKNIYSKLAVHSRTQAIAQARALKLLQ